MSLKVFLLTLATLDDLGAIIIIAAFYTSQISTGALALAAIAVVILVILNRIRYSSAGLYMIMGAI